MKYSSMYEPLYARTSYLGSVAHATQALSHNDFSSWGLQLVSVGS